MSENSNILVIDDEAEICQVIKRVLEREGYNICIARDGCQALDKIEHEDFDLIISDILMPNMSGKVLLELLREKGISVRVILITGDPSAAEFARKNADAYLTKPLGTSQLKEAVKRLIGESHGKELVCISLGLKFYASPKNARLLRARAVDVIKSEVAGSLLKRLGREDLLDVCIEPAVDVTPTFTKIKKGLLGLKENS